MKRPEPFDPELDLPKYSERDLQQLAAVIRERTRQFARRMAVMDARNRLRNRPKPPSGGTT